MNRDIKILLTNSNFQLIDLIKIYFGYKVILIVSVFISLGISLFKYGSLPIEYESVAIKLIESSSPSPTIGANIPGLDLGGITSGSDALSSDLYPDLLENKIFLLELGDNIFFIPSKKRNMTLREYLINNQPVSIYNFNSISFTSKSNDYTSAKRNKYNYGYRRNLSASDSIFQLNPEDDALINNLQDRIKIEVDGKKIILTCKMPDPTISAKVNNLVFDKIVDYMMLYKQEKQKKSLDFIRSRLDEAEKNFKMVQLKLAKYRDSNVEVSSEVVNINEQRLQSDYELSFQIYSNLKQELENTKIQLNKESPVFRTFERAFVPSVPISYSVLKYIIFAIAIGSFGWFLFVSLILCFKYFKN